MRSAVEPEAHRIAGVTFEGRQEAVQKLQAGKKLQHAFLALERTLLSESCRHIGLLDMENMDSFQCSYIILGVSLSCCSVSLCCAMTQMKP